MNIKRFTARTSSEALKQVRLELGQDAVVLSTKPGVNGVEVLAMASDSIDKIEQAAARTPQARPAPGALTAEASTQANAATDSSSRKGSLAERIAARGERLEPRLDLPPVVAPRAFAVSQADATTEPVDQDVQTLGMSTLSFQDYVRERMLKRRQTELGRGDPDSGNMLAASLGAQRGAGTSRAAPAPGKAAARPAPASAAPSSPSVPVANTLASAAQRESPFPRRSVQHALAVAKPAQPSLADSAAARAVPALVLGDEPAPSPRRARAAPSTSLKTAPGALSDRDEMLGELRSVRQLIEERFGALAFMDKLQRNPRQVALAQQLFDTGLSPGMVRKLVQALPADRDDDLAWAAGVLERNLATDEQEPPLEDHEGVYALIGPTGVGKTTSTAKLAAAFASRHGAANLGLITLDAYRVAAHEQLRTYGRILGVPVHTAHDRASLEDLLELLSGKRLVLIDTAGMAQRDARTRELLDMLQHPEIGKLLVINAAAQGETVEDVMVAYGVSSCQGVVLSKLDEAVKLGPALDALIRHHSKIVGVANGQRVPEDWHRLSAQALVQRALSGVGGATWRMDSDEVNLLFAAGLGAPRVSNGLHA